ncbi:MAG: family 10 glycosylhydrolase [Ardenticatenaceae bacterium]
MRRRHAILILLFLLITLFTTRQALTDAVYMGDTNNWLVYIPIALKGGEPAEPMVEVRGLWVSRFDWTSAVSPAEPAKIDEIVENAATAGFNVIYFQVRGAGDAYYTPGLEPWARRVSGTYGQAPEPLWDPLAYFVEKAHERNIQLHAYINVYPIHDDCNDPPDPNVSPKPFYHLLSEEHGTTDGKLNGLQWGADKQVLCSAYLRATPASVFNDNHLLAIGADLVERYDIDGIHLDHIRYARNASCDPVSESNYEAECFSNSDDYADWQRRQVNGTVRKFYERIVPLKAGLWLSAAVWPIYQDYWGWGGASQGYHDYYQDSKAWLAEEHIHSISPMIYPGTYNCDDPGFWTLEKWQLLVANFQADSNGGFIVPGIGAGYCDFSEIAARIEFARQTGTAGHALFSYRGLLEKEYFDDLAAGPYATPALVPSLSQTPVPSPSHTPTTTVTQTPTNTPVVDNSPPFIALSPSYLPNCGLTQIKGTIRDQVSNSLINGVTVRVWFDGASEDQFSSNPSGSQGQPAGEWNVVLDNRAKKGEWYVQIVDGETTAALSERQTVFTDTGPCRPGENGHQVVIQDFLQRAGPGTPIPTATMTNTPGPTNTPSPTNTPTASPTSTPTPLISIQNEDVEIPDDSLNGAESRITISDTVTIRQVRIYVHVVHSDTAQIEMDLIHPDGTRVRLHSQGQNQGQNEIDQWFDSNDADLDTLAGKPSRIEDQPGGDIWRLQIIDSFEGQVGQLLSWQMEIYP